MKGPFIIGCLSVTCIGYILLLSNVNGKAKMVAACMITAGLYPTVVLTVTWLGINTGGFTKRGTTWAMGEVFGQCFSIMGQKMYNTPPRYIKGHAIALGFMVLSMLSALVLIFWMKHLNAKRDRILAEYAARGETHPHTNMSLEEEYDFHINFRYIL